jgi:pyruvate,water dikinase
MRDGWITDNEPSIRYPIYTRANAGEVMPDPMSPMTGTLGMMHGGEAGWRDAYVRTGTFDHEEFEDDRPNTIGCFGGYLYLNMSMTRLYGVRCPGLTPEIVDFQYFGTMPGIPPYEPQPTDESPKHTALLQEYLNWVFSVEDLPELRELAADVDRIVAARPDLAHATDEELIERARAMIPHYRRVFDQHISTSGASGIGIGTVAGVCQAIGDPSLTMRLVGGAGDVDSAAPSYALWDMSRLVRRSPALTRAFDAGVEGVLAAARAAGEREFLAQVDDFIARFGSRGPNEWELRSHTWETKPELFLAAVDRMRLASDDESPKAKQAALVADREMVVEQVKEALAGDPEALGQFLGGVRASLLFLPGRERTKTANIKIVHEMRLPLRELGRRFVERGVFDHVELIFMLRNDELEELLSDPEKFGTTAREREADYLVLFELEPPFIIVGPDVPPLSTWPRRAAAAGEVVPSGTVLSGIPGCPGVATGRARVVLDPYDPRGLEPGDVLIAPATDPAWTPLFVPAAAVVVNVGAQITHAVIVSRELGIPCVVSVTGATSKIPDGAQVTVDGTAGTVTVL